MSLGLNDQVLVSPLSPQTSHKSAGLAFLFSLFLPGAGQLYCGKISRGFITLGFWGVGIIFSLAGRTYSMLGTGIFVAFALWVFAFLDAYLTAIEVNQEVDLQVEVSNPRVAVVLNLLTAGLGYFYLGERAKGITLFVVINLMKLVVAATAGYWQGLFQILMLAVSVGMAVDAYRLATEQIREALGPDREPRVVSGNMTRLPLYVPVGLATLTTSGFLAMIVFGLAVTAIRGHQSSANQKTPFAGLSVKSRQTPQDRAVGELLTTSQGIQKLERKLELSQDDVPLLQRDVETLSTVLASGDLNSADEPVAYYYRAQALRLVNAVHKREGDKIDIPMAKGALEDFDKVIAGNSNAYLREVTVANSEYWAGSVAQNYLHSESKAYSYWEKCAVLSHAGCLYMMAIARLTGEGGQKVDVQEALQFNSWAFSIGIRGECAGPFAARNIAKIVHFTGVHRPGDDELAWLNRSYGLMDQLEQITHDKDVCHRSQAEVEEFLYRLDRGKRNARILQQAFEHVGENAPAAKAVIKLLSGTTDQKSFEAAVESSKSDGARCSAYFDAMWYAETTKQRFQAERYYKHLIKLGSISCGTELFYAKKFAKENEALGTEDP